MAEAGEPYGIGPGAPNMIERIESGLLSYRGDTPDDADPFEVRLDRFVDLDAGVDFIGRDALLRKRAAGLNRQLVGVWVEGDALAAPEHLWPVQTGVNTVGALRAAAHSPRLGRNIGMAFVEVPYNRTGARLTACHPNGPREIEVADLPFL